ncbi:filamentous hemagglutinin family N-terminal domain containing protein [Caulobacter sp. AP07]|uniref:YDG domain-containing protein n=1 Tax=Caulobacter sp. AP07 TaxID=1144304 RepID=UPI000271D9AA|nr:YDG domain-containing protein [Caulobacter sp. AP07]EJL36294.1 filamentous hemagglutinin family N-terminal domain containing protein [Caulobacter sp. AP07]
MSRRRHLEQGSLFALSLLPLMMAASAAAAQALPSGGSVASGSATIGYTGPGAMTISQTSDKAIINWSDFSIAQNNSVSFNNGAGATLNRVTGANVSNLDGLLNATGSVYLINPNGVIIGTNGTVDVGGRFVASALNVSDANFLAGGPLTFEGPGAGLVVNYGQIGALGGDVALIATTVRNEGKITADQGTVGLAAGRKVLLRDAKANDGKFVVEVGGSDTAVTNAGAISAAEIELRANGGNIYALAGNVGDLISATSITENTTDGRVFLTAGAGNVESSGVIEASASVQMSGAQVAIAGSQVSANDWRIDAAAFSVGDAEATALNGAMAGRANVTVTTHGGAANGDIVIGANNVILNAGSRKLTLSAFRDVVINSDLDATATSPLFAAMATGGSIDLRADNTGAGTGVVAFADNTYLLNGTVNIFTNSANYADYATINNGYQNHNDDDASITTYLLVNSYADLQRLNGDTDGEAYGNYALGRDVDASASADGLFANAVLYGAFDGQGHTISNLRVEGYSAGLFSVINGGTVRDLNLTGSAAGEEYAGALAGGAEAASITNVTSSMTVTNDGDGGTGGLLGYASRTTIEDSASSGSVTGGDYTGGLVGYSYLATIVRGEATGDVTGGRFTGGLIGMAIGANVSYGTASGAVRGAETVGGLVGIALESDVSHGTASGAVSGAEKVGGLVGYGEMGQITDASATGAVTGMGDNTGGLVGEGNGVALTRVSATGLVAGQNSTGGLVGLMSGNATLNEGWASGDVTGAERVGGLVGVAQSSTLNWASASGDVTGTYTVGGLVGVSGGSNISTSYATGDVQGGGYGVGGLVGVFQSGLVDGAHATGKVTGRNSVDVDGNPLLAESVGGLIGTSSYASVQNSWASGDVGGDGVYFGGLAGSAYGGGQYDQTWASGDVAGQYQVGGLIGHAGNGLGLSNSHATGAVRFVEGLDYDAQVATGGLVGYADSVSFLNTYAKGAVTGGGLNTGGLIGLSTRGNTVQTSWASGDVTGLDRVGGLIGAMNSFDSGSRDTVSQSYATGKVTGGEAVGGLVGYIQGTSYYDEEEDEHHLSSFEISDSYATGAVTGAEKVGGLIGHAMSGLIEVSYVYSTGSATATGSAGWAGGLIGSMDTGIQIHDGYATGAVSGAVAGGLFGHYTGSVVSNLYWDTDSSGMTVARGDDPSNTDNVTGLTRTQAFNPGSYNFTDNTRWAFIGGLRPLLRSEYSTTINNVHQLQLIALNTSTSYVLGADFSAAETSAGGSSVFGDGGFSSIGSFYGQLDGAGHQISGLTIDSAAADVGLFGVIQEGALVHDFALVGGSMTGAAGGRVGAIAGRNYGDVRDVRSSATVSGDLVTGGSYAGGLVGYNSGTIQGSAFRGSVSGYTVGGVAGFNNGAISDSYSAGAVQGTHKVGGIVGENGGGSLNSVLNTSTVTGDNKVGALVGYANGGSLYNGRWSTTVNPSLTAMGRDSSVASQEGNVGYSTADLQDETKFDDVYSGFDTDIWVTGSGAGASSDNLAHFAELYVADNVLLIDARTTTTYGDHINPAINSHASLRSGDILTDATVTSVFGDRTNAGTYAIDIAGGTAVRAGGGAYRVVKLNTLTVNKRTIDASLVGSVVKNYDTTSAATLTNGNYSLSGVLDGDTVGVNGPTTGHYVQSPPRFVRVPSVEVSGSNEGADAYNVTVDGITLSGADAANYELANTSATNNIGYINRALVTATVTGSKTYDGAAGLTSGQYAGALQGLVGGEVLVATVGDVTFANANAGVGKALTGGVSVNLEDGVGANYAVSSFTATGLGEIGRKTINASLTGTTTKTYDGATGALLNASNFALAGLVGEDVVTVSGAANYADKNVGAGKTVTAGDLTLSGAANGNYLLASATASGAIGQIDAKTLTAGFSGTVTKTYDGTTGATLGDHLGLSGLVAGDTVSVASTGAAYGDKNAGAGKTVTASGVSLGGADAGNYVLASTTASGAVGQIDAKTLTAGLTGTVTKTYDGTTGATLGDHLGLSGLVAGDAVSVASTGAAYADKNAGTGKTVTASGVNLGGADAGNYVLASTTASAAVGQIDAKTLTAGLTGTVTKTYDGTTVATLGNNLGLSGLVAGDTVSVASTGAAYADKNAGAGKTVTASGVNLGGADAGNYVLASTTASAAVGQINAKTLTAGLTGAVTKTYDGTTAATLGAGNYGLTGLIAGDVVTASSTGAAYADKNAGAGKTVTASGVSLGGAGSGNYVLASTSATGQIGQITQLALAITANDQTKNRNDADPKLTYVAGPLIAGDSLTGDLTRDVGETVGTYGITKGTLSAGGNYAIAFKPAVFTILLGIPPVENVLIPYIPAEGGGAAGSGPEVGTQDPVNGGAGFQLAQDEQSSQQEQQDGGTDSACSTTDTCPPAPYSQGGSTSGAIHFQGFNF